MGSIKLSITHRGRLKGKYGASGLAKIDGAVAAWIAADKARGLTTIHLAVDDAAALKPYGVKPVKGAVTAKKIKVVVDALWKKLSPDYLAIVGSPDVVPAFEVTNPTLQQQGDTDPKVATDNPYACSQSYVAGDRSSYLVPDRVAGRIPDLPGASEPAVLLAALQTGAGWKPRKPSSYAADLLACCEQWKGAGKACVQQIGRAASRLQISPPADDVSSAITKRHRALLQMIKAHGARLDARFYGQDDDRYPELLKSSSLVGRTRPGTVVGAMCCFGAGLFDPNDSAALLPGQMPIPLVYLEQGALCFAGSTTTAWVGVAEPLCADWIVTGFLKSVLAGASTGRAMLEAKQDFLAWIQKQGAVPDLADEKTLLQFVLLGDPSVHPVKTTAGPTGLTGVGAPAPALASAPAALPAVAAERRARRAYRIELGSRIRGRLPTRERVGAAKLPRETAIEAAQATQRLMEARTLARPALAVAGVAAAAKAAQADVAAPVAPSSPFSFDFAKPVVQRVARPLDGGAAAPLPKVALAAVGAAPPKRQEALEYYWQARRAAGPVVEVCLIRVTTDSAGNVVRTRVVVSS